MPEEVKLSPCTAVSQKSYKSDYCTESVDDSSQDSSFSDREMNRSENSGSSDESSSFKQVGLVIFDDTSKDFYVVGFVITDQRS